MSIVSVHGPNMVGQATLPFANVTALRADATYGTTAMTGKPAYPPNNRVVLADGTYWTWNSTAWVAYVPVAP